MKRSDFIAGFVLLAASHPGARKWRKDWQEDNETIKLASELAQEMVRQGYLEEDEKPAKQ